MREKDVAARIKQADSRLLLDTKKVESEILTDREIVQLEREQLYVTGPTSNAKEIKNNL